MKSFDFNQFPVLTTERLLLRRITMDDAPAWLHILGDVQVIRYLSDIDAPMHTLDAIQPFVTWSDQVFTARTGIRWAITLQGQPTMIGTCGFHDLNTTDQRADVGYELSSQYWRKGIMREALTAVLDFCFDRLTLHRVQADVTQGNEASAGILRHLGFLHEGTWREAIYSKGRFQDLWQFGLLAHEYYAARKKASD